MKKVIFSIGAVAVMSSFGFAGGDISPVVVAPMVDEADERSPFYVGFGVGGVSNRDSSISLSFSDNKDGQDRTGNVSFLAGYDLSAYTEYLAIEGRFTTSFTDEDKVKMDAWSLFLKPKYTFEDDNGEKGNFTVYGLIGFGNVNIDGHNGWLVNVNDTGFQWGLGASYFMTDGFSIFADYTNLANDMNGFDASALVGINKYRRNMEADVDAFTVGVTYQF